MELGNALVSAHRSGRIDDDGLALATAVIQSLPLRTLDISLEEAVGPVMELARVYDLTEYDAAFLHIAIRESAPLATLDLRLRRAAAAAGVEVIE
jgi:predicted nucleic acid-binding protein